MRGICYMLSITVIFDKGYDRAVQHLLSLMSGRKTENERCYFVCFAYLRRVWQAR